MIYILLLILIIFLVIAYITSDQEITSPSVLFSAGFVLMTFFATLNQNKWSLYLDNATFFVIAGGVGEFLIVTLLTGFFLKAPKAKNISITLKNIRFLKAKRLYILALLVLLNLLIIMLEVRKITGITNPVAAANYMNASSRKANNLIVLSGRASLLGIVNTATGIWAEYYFAKYFLLVKKFSAPLACIIIISTITPLFTGVRGGSFTLIISLFVCFFLIINTIKRTENRTYIKYIGIAFVCMILVLVGLPWTASIVGRDVTQFTPFDYVSIYLGAQLKNLSLFIQNGQFPVNNGIFGAYTFYSIIPTVAKIMGITIPNYLAYLPFQYVNGYNLGNVYTAFYTWIYDFGYNGMIVITALMAIIAQLIYNFAKRAMYKNKNSISPLLYAYMSSFIFLSFFADNFIRQIGINLVYTIIVWLILNKIFFSKDDKKERVNL